MVDWTTFISPAIIIVGGLMGYTKFKADVSGRIKGQEDTLVRHDDAIKDNKEEAEVRFEHVENRVGTLELQAAEARGFRDGFKMSESIYKKGV